MITIELLLRISCFKKYKASTWVQTRDSPVQTCTRGYFETVHSDFINVYPQAFANFSVCKNEKEQLAKRPPVGLQVNRLDRRGRCALQMKWKK